MAWAFWQHPVSSPRSSNRTCGFPASGFPTGFIARHTVDGQFGLVSGDDTVARTHLRLATELVRTLPNLNGVARLIANHRPFASSQACQKSGSFAPPALPGINARTTLSDSRQAYRACHDIGVATSDQSGSPPITRITFPTCRAHYPGGSSGCSCRLLPRSCSLPQMAGGSASALSLVASLLRLHSHYGPPDRSAAQGDLCHEASARPVTRPSRSSATGPIDNYPCGTLLHW